MTDHGITAADAATGAADEAVSAEVACAADEATGTEAADSEADGTEAADSDEAGALLVRVGSVRELVDGGQRTITTVGDHEVLALAVDGQVYAVSNFCTHKRARLDGGQVFTETLELKCMVHAGHFSLATGEATKLPCRVPLRTYTVLIRGDHVYARVPAAPPPPAA